MSGTLHLRKFTTTFYKNKNASDSAQVVAPGATVTVYRQGATCASGPLVTTGGGGTSVTLRSVGHILVNDTVQLGTDATKQMLVLSITNDTIITLRSTTGSNIQLTSGDRLVIYSALPSLFSESSGVSTLANPTTTDASGALTLYTPETKFDLIVSGSGLTTTLMIDNESGWSKSGASWVNAKDYSTIQAAVDALSSGLRGTVFIPAGTYTPSSTPAFNGVNLNFSNTHLLGESGFTTLQLTDANTNIINIKAFACSVRNIAVLGPGTAGSGIGINAYVAAGATNNIMIENCAITNTSSWGISFTCDPGWSCYRNTVRNCDLSGAASGGSLLYGVSTAGSTSLFAENCHFHGPGFGTHGVSATRGAVHIVQTTLAIFTKCYWEMFSSTTGLSLAAVTNNIAVRDCEFEYSIGSGDNQQYMITNSGNLNMLLLSHVGASRTSTAVGIRLFSSEATANMRACKFESVLAADSHAAAQSDDIVLGAALDQLMMIGNRHSSLVTGASRTFTTTSRAGLAYLIGDIGQEQIRIPAVASTAVITAPLDGSIIYNSATHKIMVYENGSWKTVTTT